MGFPQRWHRFELLKRIGVGGMAEVFLARVLDAVPQGMPGFIVVKRVLPQHVDDAVFVRMFRDEARVGALLRHRNLLEFHGAGVHEGVPFMALEFVDGVNLAALMDELASRTTRLPIPVAMHLVAEACRGLHHAHDARDEAGRPLDLVHRDVSPHNIMVARSGAVKLLDFGVARTNLPRERTQTGVLKGKMAYMAPEYCRGEPADRRADVFAMGVTLHELLTGKRLFADKNPLRQVQRILDERVEAPGHLNADVPPELDLLVLSALEKDPRHRTPSALVLAEGLESLARRMGWNVSNAVVGQWLVEHVAHKLPGGRGTSSMPEPVDLPVAQGVPATGPVVMPIEGVLLGVAADPAVHAPGDAITCPELARVAGFSSELNQMFADAFERHASGDTPSPHARTWRGDSSDPFAPRGPTRDLKAANRAFYARLFSGDGLAGRIQGGERRWVQCRTQDPDLARAGVEVSTGTWVSFLRVSALDRVLPLVEPAGGRVLHLHRNPAGGALVIIQDPQGGTLGLLAA